MEKFENKIEKERGANIELILHILRHGDKSSEGMLHEYGRKQAKDTASLNKHQYSEGVKIKPFGSPAGPKSGEAEMERSLETSHIYGSEISAEKRGELYKTRPRSLLNYEDWDVLIIDPEYDYDGIYKKYLEEYVDQKYNGMSYENLTEDQQKKASFYASNGATRYYLELNTENGIKSRKEVAGTFAVLIKHYVRMIQEKLNSNQKFLFPLGSHTGMIEPFLSESVIWKDKDENERHGATLDEMGGIFKPAEGFDIVLKTDQDGKLEQVQMRFDDQSRLGGEVYLNMQKVDELAEFYRELHEKNEKTEPEQE